MPVNHRCVKYTSLAITAFISPSVRPSVFQVAANSEINKMTNSNLAVVFGPNLLWGRDNAMSLSAIGPINNFTRALLDQQHLVFE